MAQHTLWVHQYPLRDLVDDTFDLFKERATTLLLAGVIPYSLVVVYVFLMRTYVIPGNFLRRYDTQAVVDVLGSWQFWGFILGLAACNTVAFAIGHLAQCRIAVAQALGEEISLLRSFRPLVKPFWSLIVVLLIYFPLVSIISSVTTMAGMMVGGLLLALASMLGPAGGVVGGIITFVFAYAGAVLGFVLVSIYFITVPMLLAHEHLGPFAAMGRAYRIAAANYKSHFWAFYVLLHVPTFFWPITVMLVGLLMYVLKFISPITNVIISSLVGNLVSAVCFGLAACFGTLAYLDGRCRLEAFDLLVLARRIGLGDELARALQQGPAAVASQFPDYSARRPAPVVAAHDMPASSAPTGFPDYSAPPPPSPEVPDGE